MSAGSVSISYCGPRSGRLLFRVASVLLMMVWNASWVSKQKVVMETRMKNKDAKAINCRGREETALDPTFQVIRRYGAAKPPLQNRDKSFTPERECKHRRVLINLPPL